MSRQTTLLKNTAVLALGKFSTQFIAFILLPIYTRFLSPGEYGTFDLIMTYVLLAVPFLTLRLEYAAFRFLIDARKDETEKVHIISTTLKFILGLCSLIVLIYIVISYYVHIPYGYLALATALVMVASGTTLQLARGFGQNTKFAVASIIIGLATSIGSTLLIVVFGWGIEGILVSSILGNLFGFIYITISLKLMRYIKWSRTSKGLQKELLRFGVPMVPSGMAWWAINSFDRTVIVSVLGLAANGIYAIASKYSLILVSIAMVFGLAWKESASLHINSADRDEYFSHTINSSLRLFASLGVLLISATPLLFATVFDDAYREAMLYIPILVVASFFTAMVELYAGVYVAKKLSGKLAVTNITAAIISISLNLTLIHFIGLYAAAISMMLAFGAMAAWRAYDVRKYVTIRYDLSYVTPLLLLSTVVTTAYYIDKFWLHLVILAVTFITVYWLNKQTASYIKLMWSKKRSKA